MSKNKLCVQMYTRQRVPIRLPAWKIQQIDRYCINRLTRTAYIEKAIDKQMATDKINQPQGKVINTWGNDIEKMPLYPEYKTERSQP